MRQLILAACILGGSMLLSSCGPSYFLTMAPAHNNGPIVNGQPTSLSARPADSVEVRVGFVRYDDKELVFEVEVNNSSTRPVLVAPETFYYLPLYSYEPDTLVSASAAASVVVPARVSALDPETYMLQLNEKLDKHASKAENGTWLEVLSSVATIAEDVSSSKKKETPEQIAEREQRRATDEAYFAEQREQHAQEADKLYEQLESLKSVVLRKTLLPSHQYVSGLVHFPRNDAARQLRLVVFFNERPVTFHFTQTPGLR